MHTYIHTYILEIGNECMRWDFKYKCKTTIVLGLAILFYFSTAKISTNYLHGMLEVQEITHLFIIVPLCIIIHLICWIIELLLSS